MVASRRGDPLLADPVKPVLDSSRRGKSRKLLFPESTRWRIVAPGPALGTGRSRRGHGSAARDSGPGSLTERLSARRPFPVLCTGWVALTAEQSACRGRQLGVLAWATSTSRRLPAGSRPLCLRAVVCCPAPSSACALRGRRPHCLDVLAMGETIEDCSEEPGGQGAAVKTPPGAWIRLLRRSAVGSALPQ